MIDLEAMLNVRGSINRRCGKCGRQIPKGRITYFRDIDSGEEGLLFRCHGKEDRLILSEATARMPRRLKGWRPFTEPTAIRDLTGTIVGSPPQEGLRYQREMDQQAFEAWQKKPTEPEKPPKTQYLLPSATQRIIELED